MWKPGCLTFFVISMLLGSCLAYWLLGHFWPGLSTNEKLGIAAGLFLLNIILKPVSWLLFGLFQKK